MPGISANGARQMTSQRDARSLSPDPRTSATSGRLILASLASFAKDWSSLMKHMNAVGCRLLFDRLRSPCRRGLAHSGTCRYFGPCGLHDQLRAQLFTQKARIQDQVILINVTGLAMEMAFQEFSSAAVA